MALADVVVGNSSSGLYEAPSLKTPTVDIGDRQRGRLAAASVIHCEAKRDAIAAAIARAFQMDCQGVINPYGDGHSAPRIIEIIQKTCHPQSLLKKAFHSIV